MFAYTESDIIFSFDFEADTNLSSRYGNYTLNDLGADWLENDARCQDGSCFEFGLTEGYLTYTDGLFLPYQNQTVCFYTNTEDDNAVSVIFDSNNVNGGRALALILGATDSFRWGTTPNNVDYNMGSINEIGEYYWCTTMDATNDNMTVYRDGVYIGYASESWSIWDTQTTTNIGKATGSAN